MYKCSNTQLILETCSYARSIGIQIKCIGSTTNESTLYHEKFYVIDGKAILIGSCNLTKSAIGELDSPNYFCNYEYMVKIESVNENSGIECISNYKDICNITLEDVLSYNYDSKLDMINKFEKRFIQLWDIGYDFNILPGRSRPVEDSSSSKILQALGYNDKISKKHGDTNIVSQVCKRNGCEEYSADCEFCIKCRGMIFDKGRYKGLYYRVVLEENLEYCKRLISNKNNIKKDDSIFKFIEWLLANTWLATSDTSEEEETNEPVQNIKIKSMTRQNTTNILATKKKCNDSSDVIGCITKTILSTSNNCDIYIVFGKYRGKSYQWVYENDKKYCSWVKSRKHVNKASEEFKSFGRWLENMDT